MLNGTLTTIPSAGKVTVIDFWATSCEPCLAEMTVLEQYWRTVDRTKVQVIGISLDDDSYLVEKKLTELKTTFPQIIDDGHVLKGRYLVGAIPAVFVIDQQGRIRFFSYGDNYSAKKVIQATDALLND